jgi:regulator-associated protein of mTOR
VTDACTPNRYKQSHDPTASQVKKLCIAQRRASRHERMFFHYNGHGVPRPTENGEIWVFNKQFTQCVHSACLCVRACALS